LLYFVSVFLPPVLRRVGGQNVQLDPPCRRAYGMRPKPADRFCDVAEPAGSR
jgi:hypothetical protein